jgi:phospholipase D1/2
VFLIDQDFTIERPKRAYRTGLHLLSGKGSIKSHAHSSKHGDTIANAVDPLHADEVDTDNPLTREMIINGGEGKGDAADQMHDEKEHHASQHTFFIANSQRKIKLVAKNAVSRGSQAIASCPIIRA